MLRVNIYDAVIKKAKKFKYSSMNHIEYDDYADSVVLHDCDKLILLLDKSKTPAMLYYATDDFDLLVKIIADIPGQLRLHFVPQVFAPQLKKFGFVEWGEYVDFFNTRLTETAESLVEMNEIDYLRVEECEEASTLSHKCKLQSRGFEGESSDWFIEWLKKNKVIILRQDSVIVGYCCVSVYNEGTTLWIREIAVDPIYQGQGLGKKLMEQAIYYGAKNGAVKGFLAADILNHNAIGLYNKYGFHAVNMGEGELQMVRN